MADDAGQPRPDLAPPLGLATEELTMDGPAAEAMDLFELLRRLERGGRRFGCGGRPEDEPARLGQQVRLAFAVQDVAHFRPASGTAPAQVRVAALGLLGPEGPMPLHLTRWVFDRLSQRWFAEGAAEAVRDTTFVDFADLLQHRLIGLYYRAWADLRPEVQVERAAGGRVAGLLGALAGIGLPGTRSPDDPALDALKLRHATGLGLAVDGPERLTRMLRDLLGVPVALVEFVGIWMPIPARLQSRLGGPLAELGRSATVGARSFQRQTRIELRLGPLTRAEFTRLLPGSPMLARLRRLARHVLGETLDVDLRLILARAEIPPARLGTAALGRSAWLAHRRQQDAADLRLRALVGLPLGAAA